MNYFDSNWDTSLFHESSKKIEVKPDELVSWDGHSLTQYEVILQQNGMFEKEVMLGVLRPNNGVYKRDFQSLQTSVNIKDKLMWLLILEIESEQLKKYTTIAIDTTIILAWLFFDRYSYQTCDSNGSIEWFCRTGMIYYQCAEVQ